MPEEFNLEGQWWLPNEERDKYNGTLAFDPSAKRGLLSITSGIDFETSLMGNREVRPKHDIMLGEASDGQTKVTLMDCERAGWRRNVIDDLGWYSFSPTYVLLGEHFDRPEDIIFDSIYVTYSGEKINDWIKIVHLQARINSHDSAKVKVRGNYNISVLGKPKLDSWSDGRTEKRSRKEIPCIEIESLKEQKKSLDDYLKVNLIVFDFLNFVVTEAVHIESIQGIRKSRKGSNENNDDDNNNTSANSQEEKKSEDEVRIFYPYAISNMFKPTQRSGAYLFPYESERNETEVLLRKYLKKWFTLSDRARSFYDLYFGIMYNPEMYKRFQFLGLAQAIESYHVACKEPPTSPKWNNQVQVIKKFYPQIPKGCVDKIKDCHKPYYGDRVSEIYEEHSELADKLFDITNRKGKFIRKVASTRNYYSHAAKGKKKGVVYEEKMLPLILDLQLLLQFAIMKEIGFTEEGIIQKYALGKW